MCSNKGRTKDLAICKQSLNPTSHFFRVMMQEGNTSEYPVNRWAEIKSKIKLGNSLDEEQACILWDLLEEF